jgi:hypothetical protein
MMLVGIEDAKARLRIVHDAEDMDLELMIQQASAAVMNYLGKPLDHYSVSAGSDSDSEVSSDSESSSDGERVRTVPAEVELATLLLVGILYRDRDGMEAKDWPHGYLPTPVTAFLYPLRDPAMG